MVTLDCPGIRNVCQAQTASLWRTGRFSKQTGEIIGAVGIVPYLDTFNQVAAFNRLSDTPATAEVGLYWAIAPAHQCQGFASEAARALMNYLFTHEKLGRIIVTTGYKNLPSQKVMQKLGMTIQHLEKPQPPDQYVVKVMEAQTYKRLQSNSPNTNSLIIQARGSFGFFVQCG